MEADAFAHLVRGWVFRKAYVFCCERSTTTRLLLPHLYKSDRSVHASKYHCDNLIVLTYDILDGQFWDGLICLDDLFGYLLRESGKILE
jgi:hypothetical protein